MDCIPPCKNSVLLPCDILCEVLYLLLFDVATRNAESAMLLLFFPMKV